MKKLLKKSISFILAFTLILGALELNSFFDTVKAEGENSSQIWDGSADTGFAGGTGTEADPYEIATAEQLAFLAQSVNGGEAYLNKYFKLTNDIQLNNVSNFDNWETSAPANKWVPIGNTYNTPFIGYFDGNGHTISGLYIESESHCGLFGYIGRDDKGGAYNINIENCYIYASKCSAGALVAYFYGSHLHNITTTGKIIAVGLDAAATNSTYCLGGVVGSLVDHDIVTTISDCTNNIDITVTGYSFYVGGIVGSSGFRMSVDNCTNNGDITYTNSKYGLGGIVGKISSVTVSNCFNNGTIIGAENVGGIFGAGGTNLYRCLNTAPISGTTYVGGLSGTCLGGTISESYNTGDVNGTTYVGGLSGLLGADVGKYSNYTSKIENCYNTGDVTATSKYAGGIAGRAASYSWSSYSVETDVKTCYNTGTVVGKSYFGGIVGEKYSYSRNMKGHCYVNDCAYLKTCVTNPSNTLNYPVDSLKNTYQYANNWVLDGTGAWKLSTAINNREAPVLKWQKADLDFSGEIALEGEAKVGSRLTVNFISLEPASERNYMRFLWYSDGVLLDKSVYESTYRLTVDDLGHRISVAVYSDGDYRGQLQSNEVFVPYENVVWDGTAATKFFGGSGTYGDPYIIKTPHQLKYLSDVVNNGTIDTDEEYFKDKYYRLESDIYLNDLIKSSSLEEITNKNYWTPIGGQKKFALDPQPASAQDVSGYMHNLGFIQENNTGAFAYEVKYSAYSTYYRSFVFDGVFDGNGHTIYGMETRYASSNYQGLFGVSCGVVRNVNIDKSFVRGNKNIGGIVGLLTTWNNHYGIVENCTSYADISASSYGAGGIVGCAMSAESVACSKQDSMQITLQNCKNYGKVEGYGDIGGIIGAVDRKYMNALDDGIEQQVVKYASLSMTQCANFGTIGKKDRNQAGGLIGWLGVEFTRFDINKSYNKGYVFGNEYVAGLFGYISGWADTTSHSVNYCYNIGPVQGTNYVGGLVGGAGYIYVISGEISNSERIYFNSVYNAGRVTKVEEMGGSLFGSTYGAEKVPFFVIKNVYWLDNTAAVALPEGDYSIASFDKNLYVKSSDSAMIDLLNENIIPVWLADTNNSNGGFPELEEGADNSGYYIDFSADEHDYITPDKTIAAPGETVNFITTTHPQTAPYIFVDGKEIAGYSFKTTSNHTVHAEYRELIELPQDIKVTVTPDTYVYDGSYHTPAAVVEGYTEGVDYTLGYSNNREPGTAYVWVKGCGKYTGSVLVPFTIEKMPQAAPTVAPNLSKVTANSITFEYLEGYEYKIEGGEWQKTSTFENLQPATLYTVYWRLAEKDYYAPSAPNDGRLVKTYKLNAEKPEAPTLIAVTDTTVLLNAVEGCEYKFEGGQWQSSAYFTDLNPETEYVFYQRKAETATSYYSSISDPLKVVTLKSYTPGDIDDNNTVDLNDVVTLAQYVAGWEITCNEKALDVNGDGGVDLNDVVTLAQYVAGWDSIILH